jgi:hypothetical protein
VIAAAVVDDNNSAVRQVVDHVRKCPADLKVKIDVEQTETNGRDLSEIEGPDIRLDGSDQSDGFQLQCTIKPPFAFTTN